MKKFWENVIEWKTHAALLFSGSVVLSAMVMYILRENALPLTTILSLLIVSCVGTFLQFLAFSDRIIKNMRYTLRMIVFAVPFFLLLLANAQFFRWFPPKSVYFLTFSIIFIVVFLIMTICFEIYYRIMGRKYDGLLGQYRKQKESERRP